MAHKRQASVITCKDFSNVNVKLYFAELLEESNDKFIMKETIN